MDKGQVGAECFKPLYFGPHINTYIQDEISVIVDPLIT